MPGSATLGSGFSVYRKIDGSPEVSVHGQVFTKPHIVSLILDLAGYTTDKRLSGKRLLEPGCGNGAFLLEAARRLLISLKGEKNFANLKGCLLGIERDADLVEQCRQSLIALFDELGVPKRQAVQLSKAWVIEADFIEWQLDAFDFVVGNPPYVRQEAIPKKQLEKLRVEFPCFYDRADLYMAFLEKGLYCLAPDGKLAVICPNRFTKNRYGKKLRNLITTQYSVETIIDLPAASPFEPEVLAYPGIYVVAKNQSNSKVQHVLMDTASPQECNSARTLLGGGKSRDSQVVFHTYETWFQGEDQWAVESPFHLALLRRIEDRGIPIGNESSGCKVGIGVATGADEVFIVQPKEVEVERELLLPLVTTRDILTGEIEWSGKHVINPFKRDGTLIDLNEYPLAKKYFARHQKQLVGRNVAKRKAGGWYRTIDRIYPGWATKPMLLIPDIKANNETIALKEKQRLYPHHNLYFITSEYWNLHALRTIFRSSIAKYFVWMYGVKMREGYFRFQAQYLRRICIPPFLSADKALVKELVRANGTANIDEVDELVADLYGLSMKDMRAIRDVMRPVK